MSEMPYLDEAPRLKPPSALGAELAAEARTLRRLK